MSSIKLHLLVLDCQMGEMSREPRMAIQDFIERNWKNIPSPYEDILCMLYHFLKTTQPPSNLYGRSVVSKYILP